MKKGIGLLLCLLLSSCSSFHLQGKKELAAPLHRLYLQTPDPYGQLDRNLQGYLKISNVQLVPTAEQATTILIVTQDSTAQNLLGGNSTNQTRQYNLVVTVVFEITDKHGKVILAPTTLTDSRIITVQSDQILGSSNEAIMFYQQMRRGLAYAIMNRIASKQVTRLLQEASPR